MKLRFDQLQANLSKGLAPIYLISGDEPLQIQEAADTIRQAVREAGYSEREVMHVEKGFDWNSLAAASSAMSLFAEQRLLDLRMPSGKPGKPGKPGGAALTEYAARPAEDTILLITSGKLDKSAQNSKWFKSLDRVGVTLQVWPIDIQQLPNWIARRMKQKGMSPTREVCSLIAERVEGNLLAADQEVEKLFLLHGAGEIDLATVSAAVADSARFDVYSLADSALLGNTARAVRILDGLRAEGVEPILILWALTREIRQLAKMAHELARGGSLNSLFSSYRIWQSRQPLLRSALKRHKVADWDAMLSACAHLDRVLKGAAQGSRWDELLQLTLRLTGTDPMARATA
ncbi:DNA polymerase III subunit delta [Solemya pervernicosa gill symbiont]|uniref:DNA polymerase III subunit delta n=2 Tax=Gammaproteobacteria incertae sedis TaxID=118884 RepID=A0A1T2L767_9GAMM|nr:DNA polymerase III subunit delta [Candidatus Reidiella endopervernicosa]OOZ40900.1 DNA polymerase III subunit delta [Solemya pervernicosa gill symbiont]QKQ26124.1 DNA polymerase III subunit delta [Candidatus Reidiella endopervernicosa]